MVGSRHMIGSGDVEKAMERYKGMMAEAEKQAVTMAKGAKTRREERVKRLNASMRDQARLEDAEAEAVELEHAQRRREELEIARRPAMGVQMVLPVLRGAPPKRRG